MLIGTEVASTFDTYNGAVDHGVLNLDTSPDAERELIARWRAMTPEQKLRAAFAMSDAVRDLALAGIRQRYPHANAREQFLRLVILQHGHDLAVAAYPEARHLNPS